MRSSKYVSIVKTLDQAVYLLEEYANDHGYCNCCKEKDSSKCDPNICAVAECIDQCKKLSKEITGCYIYDNNSWLIDKVKNYIDYIKLRLL